MKRRKTKKAKGQTIPIGLPVIPAKLAAWKVATFFTWAGIYIALKITRIPN